MHAIAAADSADDVIGLARRTGHSRFPVYAEDLDDITGVVHLKAAVSVPRDRRTEVPVGALSSEPLRVPETVHLDALVAELRGGGYQLAIVVDEYGGTAGIVTLEDLVEEIVGEVSDEHDRSRAGVVKGRDGITFPAELRPDELRGSTGIEVPEGDVYDTVGGYVMSVLERLPKAGDEVSVPGGTLHVVRMQGRRVDRIRFIPAPSAEEGGER